MTDTDLPASACKVVKYPYMAKRKSKKRDADNYRALIKWVSAILLIALFPANAA